MCVQAGFGGSLKPRKHEQRLLRNMGVHKVRLKDGQGVFYLDNVLGGPGPAADSIRCQRRCSNERVNETSPYIPSELLPWQSEQSGMPPLASFIISIKFI